MALAIFSSEGNVIDYTPSADVAAGDVVVQGDLVGIARTPIAANAPGSLAIEGLFDFPKATGAGSGIAVGTKVYWDATDKQATATADTNKYLGKTAKTAADGDATVRVRLIP
jgi:predicted RecA/RadA family phage recombinase